MNQAETSKSEAIKCVNDAQRNLTIAMVKMLDISPVVASSKPYEAAQKIELLLRQLVGQISAMRVS